MFVWRWSLRVATGSLLGQFLHGESVFRIAEIIPLKESS
jgi:hypothetical protein